MKFNNKFLDENFKINSDFYDKDLVSYVDYFCELMAKDKDKDVAMILKGIKPLLLNFGHNLLVFVFSINGDFNRINELKIKNIEQTKIKPIIEKYE